MPFKKGVRLPNQGGYRANAGRKRNSDKARELQNQQTALEVFRAELQRQSAKVVSTYFRLASTGNDPQTTRHAIDKIAPDLKNATESGPSIIQFVQFNHNTIQVSAENVSAPILASDAERNKESGVSVAQESGQGQDSIEFYDFTNVRRE